MLETTTDGHPSTRHVDATGVSAQPTTHTVTYELSDLEWQTLEEAAATENRDPCAQARAWMRQKLGSYKAWQSPATRARPKRKR